MGLGQCLPNLLTMYHSTQNDNESDEEFQKTQRFVDEFTAYSILYDHHLIFSHRFSFRYAAINGNELFLPTHLPNIMKKAKEAIKSSPGSKKRRRRSSSMERLTAVQHALEVTKGNSSTDCDL